MSDDVDEHAHDDGQDQAQQEGPAGVQGGPLPAEVAQVTHQADDDQDGQEGAQGDAEDAIVPQGVPAHLGAVQNGPNAGRVVRLRNLCQPKKKNGQPPK